MSAVSRTVVISIVMPKRAAVIEELMGSPAPTRVPRALGEPHASMSLGRGKGKGRGAKGVGPSHREQGNGQQGKSFSAETIP